MTQLSQRAAVSRFWDLVQVLSARALVARYRGSRWGPFWASLQPLFVTAVYCAVFGRHFGGRSLLAYAGYVYVGLSALGFFVGSTANALGSIVANRTLFSKVRTPVAVFPTSTVSAYTVQLAVGTLPFLVLLTLTLTRNPVRLLPLALALAALVAVAEGVALLMSAVNVYVRGLPQMYDLVIFLLWIGTPVFYPMSIVPEPVRTVLMYSPMYFVVTAIRSAVTDPAPLDTGALLGAMAAGLCSLAIGVLAFRALRPRRAAAL